MEYISKWLVKSQSLFEVSLQAELDLKIKLKKEAKHALKEENY